MKPSQMESLLADLRSDRSKLVEEMSQIDVAIGYVERKYEPYNVPAIVFKDDEEPSPQNGHVKIEKPARASTHAGGPVRASSAAPKRNGTTEPKKKRRRKETPPATPLTAQITATILGVVMRVGRFLYPEQVASQLLHDGRDFGADLPKYLPEISVAGGLIKVRYNNVNICVAYGLPGWKPDDDEHAAQGKNTDPQTAELLT